MKTLLLSVLLLVAPMVTTADTNVPGAIFMTSPDGPNLRIMGNAIISGNDCDLNGAPTGSGIQVAGIATQDDATTLLTMTQLSQPDQVTGLGFVEGPPPTPSVRTNPVDFNVLQNMEGAILALPGVITVSSGLPGGTWGSCPNSPVIVHFTAANVRFNAGSYICGVAIFDGQFDTNGYIHVDGLILGRSNLDSNIIGTWEVHGAFWMGNSYLDLLGGVSICYSQAGMDVANNVTGGVIYSALVPSSPTPTETPTDTLTPTTPTPAPTCIPNLMFCVTSADCCSQDCISDVCVDLPSPTPTPTNTATDTPTSTPTSTATVSATSTNTPTATNTDTITPTNSHTNTPTPTETPTDTRTETPTATATPTETATNMPTATDTPTQTPTPTDTSMPVCTPPPCSNGELLCPVASCPNGCGLVCAPFTPTPTATEVGASCAPTPVVGCATAAKGQLKLQGNSDASKQKLKWKWAGGNASLSEFGDPAGGTTNYRLCIYDDGALKTSMGIESSGTLWAVSGSSGQKYKNKLGNSDGVTQVKMKASTTGSAQVQVKGKGAGLTLPFPIVDTNNVTVQLVKNPSSGPECWQSVFPNPAKTNDATKMKFQAKLP